MNYKIASYALLAAVVGCDEPKATNNISSQAPQQNIDSFKSFGTTEFPIGYFSDNYGGHLNKVIGLTSADYDNDGKTDIALLVLTHDGKTQLVIIKNEMSLDTKLTPEKEDKK